MLVVVSKTESESDREAHGGRMKAVDALLVIFGDLCTIYSAFTQQFFFFHLPFTHQIKVLLIPLAQKFLRVVKEEKKGVE